MGILVMLVLVSAVSLTVVVSQQQQTLKQRASEAEFAQCGEGLGGLLFNRCEAATEASACDVPRRKCLSTTDFGDAALQYPDGKNLVCCPSTGYSKESGTCKLVDDPEQKGYGYFQSPTCDDKILPPPCGEHSCRGLSLSESRSCAEINPERPTKCLLDSSFWDAGSRIEGKWLACCSVQNVPATCASSEGKEGICTSVSEACAGLGSYSADGEKYGSPYCPKDDLPQCCVPDASVLDNSKPKKKLIGDYCLLSSECKTGLSCGKYDEEGYGICSAPAAPVVLAPSAISLTLPTLTSPANTTSIPIDKDNVIISWSPPAPSGVGYQLEWRKQGTATYAAIALTTSLTTGTASWSLSSQGLDDNAIYNWHIRVFQTSNPNNIIVSPEWSFKTGVPAPTPTPTPTGTQKSGCTPLLGFCDTPSTSTCCSPAGDPPQATTCCATLGNTCRVAASCRPAAPPAAAPTVAAANNVNLALTLNVQDSSATVDTANVTLYNYNNATKVAGAPPTLAFTKTSIPGKQYQSSIVLTNLAQGTKYYIVVRKDNMIARSIFTASSATGELIAPTATLVFGDLNNDNNIDALDYNMFKGCWKNKVATGSCVSSDFDNSGTIDQIDFNTFMRGLATWNKEGK